MSVYIILYTHIYYNKGVNLKEVDTLLIIMETL